MVKTRFAPSPTGFLHIGSARTALFSWAFARKNKGKFILRIEDTDLERSTQESVDGILQGMGWLGLSYDEGPFYQTKRMDRYQVAIQELLDKDLAYYCYCTKEDLEQMRNTQKASGLKPKYNRRCLHNPPSNCHVKPVVRFKNPSNGSVVWNDLVKGRIEFSNEELDDLIIARSDGAPTYNFCVVIDDFDMQISHVIRGDDHVNNTPRQINILSALGATIPLYAHVPMILAMDGSKMSKRRDAVSVMQYKDMGILPEALLNYLAKLCWGHGNDEIFSLEQFIEWFKLEHVSGAPARFDMKKLYWVNATHLKTMSNIKLAKLINEIWQTQATNYTLLVLDKIKELAHIDLMHVIELVKSRSNNLNSLAYECGYFYAPLNVDPSDASLYLTNHASKLLSDFAASLKKINNWTLDSIKEVIKEFCQANSLKLQQIGIPLRLKLCGIKETPSMDALIYVLGINEVTRRLYAN